MENPPVGKLRCSGEGTCCYETNFWGYDEVFGRERNLEGVQGGVSRNFNKIKHETLKFKKIKLSLSI